MTNACKKIAVCAVNHLDVAAMLLSVAVSAFLIAIAKNSTDYAWMAWTNFLPLFIAIRSYRPAVAAAYGALWGILYFLFSKIGIGPVPSGSLLSLFLLTCIPAAYTGLGSLLTRAAGFNPIILGLGWVLFEFGLIPIGLKEGLLTSSQSDGSHFFHWLGHLLGSVSVAFLVACTNASFVLILSKAIHLRDPHRRLPVGIPHIKLCIVDQSSGCLQCLESDPGSPRAPPIH